MRKPDNPTHEKHKQHIQHIHVQILHKAQRRRETKQHAEAIAILRSSNMRCELHKIVMKQINAGRIQQATAKHDIGGGMQHRKIRLATHAPNMMQIQVPAHIVVITGINTGQGDLLQS